MRSNQTGSDGSPTIRYQMMAIARDVLTISAVLSVVGSIFWFMSRPYLTPFLELPEKVAQIQAQLAPLSDPKIVEFNGNGKIANLVPRQRGEDGGQGLPIFKPGEIMRVLYNLRRNADCATQVEVTFIDVKTGSKLTTGITTATQAPVTSDFTFFILNREIPNNLPDGIYSYYPRIIPLNCGIYRPYNGVMSDLFEVKRS